MSKIITKTANTPGPTLVIMAGVHGNERAGIHALDEAVQTITPQTGTIHFVYANPPAIENCTRAVEKNMNRCFYAGNTGTSDEDACARTIMSLLDRADALLDLHASTSKHTTPFVICERTAFGVAKEMPVPIISFGWDSLQEGASDGYMYRQEKPGICVECGSVYNPRHGKEIALTAIRQFCGMYNAIETTYAAQSPKRYIEVYYIHHKQNESFTFARSFSDFGQLHEGEVFAWDGEEACEATFGDVIIFPRSDKPIGGETFLLGRERM